MIAIIVQYDLHADGVEAGIALAREVAGESRQDDGCLHYVFALDVAVPNRLHLLELWRDAAAFATHAQTSHVRKFQSGMKALRVLNRTAKRGELVSLTDLGSLTRSGKP